MWSRCTVRSIVCCLACHTCQRRGSHYSRRGVSSSQHFSPFIKVATPLRAGVRSVERVLSSRGESAGTSGLGCGRTRRVCCTCRRDADLCRRASASKLLDRSSQVRPHPPPFHTHPCAPEACSLAVPLGLVDMCHISVSQRTPFRIDIVESRWSSCRPLCRSQLNVASAPLVRDPCIELSCNLD